MLRPAIINAQTCNKDIFQPGLSATEGVTKSGLAATEPGLIATEPAIVHLNQDYLQLAKNPTKRLFSSLLKKSPRIVNIVISSSTRIKCN